MLLGSPPAVFYPRREMTVEELIVAVLDLKHRWLETRNPEALEVLCEARIQLALALSVR